MHLAILLLCCPALQSEESTRRFDLGALANLYTFMPESFALAQSHVLEFGNRYGGGRRIPVDAVAWLEMVQLLVDDHNGQILDWSGLDQHPPSFGLTSDPSVQRDVAEFLAALERELGARTEIDIAAIALDEGAPASPAWMAAAEATARIEAARAGGQLVGQWSLRARPGAPGELFENRTRELIISPAVQVASNVWTLDHRTASVHEGVDILAHAAPLPGGLRLQLAFEQRRALAPVAERRLFVSGPMGGDDDGMRWVKSPALLQSQPVVSFGFQLALDLPSGQAALVEARWESADRQIGRARWLYVIQARGGASSSLIEIPFGTEVLTTQDEVSSGAQQPGVRLPAEELRSSRHFLLLAAPGGLQAPRWPALPEPQRTRLGLYEAGNSTPGFVAPPPDSPESVLQAIENVEPRLFQTRYLAGWVVGLYPGQPGDEYPRIRERLMAFHRPAEPGQGRLSLEPQPGERLELRLPLSLGRPALAYVLGCDVAVDDDQAEIATGAAASVPEAHPALRGVIAWIEPTPIGNGGLSLAGRIYGTWLAGAPTEARVDESTWIDVAPVSLFDWPVEQVEPARRSRSGLGSPVGEGPRGQLEIAF